MSEVKHSRYTALKDVIAAGVKHGRVAFTVSGDCMERSNICDGDTIGVDFTRYPKPGRKVDGKHIEDACLCYGSIPQSGVPPCLMVKAYTGVFLGMQMVGTNYAQRPGEDYRMNCGFEPIAIFGVVFAAWDSAGSLKWEIDVSDYPEELGTASTITGGNIGEPVRVARRAAV